MSTTNVTIGQLFETIGRLHIQVEALQSEVGKRDVIIAAYAKEKEAQKATQVPPPVEPVQTSTFPPITPPSPELVKALEASKAEPTPDF